MVKRELGVAGRRERADRALVPVLGAEHVADGMTDRLHRDRSLPEGYQFGDAGPTEHVHVFNSISGYCACGLQYLPHLLPYFEHGGVIGHPPPPRMDDTRPRFVTVLPP